MAKRMLTFDFLRGFAIMCIVAFHLLLLTCSLVTQAESNPFSLPIFYLGITVFTVFFAHWRGLFLLISAVVNIYVMTNSIRNGADRKKVWLGQVKFGLLLWVFGMFREVFLNEWSIPSKLAIGTSFITALSVNWTWIYLMEALEDIAWSIIITATIFYFLTRNNGVEKINRNALIFFILTIIVIFISPYTRQGAILLYGQDTVNISPESLHFLGWWDYITRIFMSLFIGYNSPLFPMLSYAFAGVVFGLLLTRPVIPKHFLRNTALISLGLVILGIVWLLFVTGIPANIGDLINFQFHPTWFIFMAIGMQLLFVLILLRLIEFNPKVNVEKALRYTFIGRRWGVTALTIYSFLALEFVVRAIMNIIVPQYNWLAFNGLPFSWTVALIVIMLLVWNLILLVWQKAKFKYSLEWFFTKIAKKNKPGKVIEADDIMGVNSSLKDPETILFVQPIQAQKRKYVVLGQGKKPE